MIATAERAYPELPGRTPDSKEDPAFDISRKAMQLLERYGIPPDPDAYALCYAYAAEADAALVAAMDKIIAQGNPISAYDIRQVYKAHLTPDAPMAAQQKIGNAFAREVSGVLDLIRDGVSDSVETRTVLHGIGADAPSADAPDKLDSLIRQLMSENQRMVERSMALHQGLEESQAQIETLNRELEDVRSQSMRDPLTAIANRRAFNVRLRLEIDRARQIGSPLCLVMIDIDLFTRVNDTFGHPVGDDGLQVFANNISKNIKGQDLVARYGGEEFAVILPKTPVEAAVTLIDNIRVQFSDKRLMLRKSRQSIGQVTASFGIAAWHENAGADDFIEQADEQLYIAKRDGRNCVRAAGVS